MQLRPLATLMRWPNLLLLALAQCATHFLFFRGQYLPAALHGWPIFALVWATVLIAAGGYIINNITDAELDAAYKPEVNPIGRGLSVKTAYTAFFVCNVLGVGLGFVVANYIEKPIMAGLFIGASALLYLYATQFKGTPLVGNLMIALLVSLSMLMVPLFNIWPYLALGNREVWASVWLDQLVMAGYAGVLTLFREWAKDMQDREGDQAFEISTLAVLWGNRLLARCQAALQLLLALFLLYHSYQYLMLPGLYVPALYVIVAVITPLLVLCAQLLKAQTTADYERISRGLKWVLVTGLLTIYVVIYTKRFV